MSIEENFKRLQSTIPKEVLVVAVSKTYPSTAIQKLYDLEHRDFGENRVQEWLQKKDELPADIRWHLIGHLQTNKVKQVIPFVYLIQSVDSLKLLNKIQSESLKLDRITSILLQVKIAQEESKYGFSQDQIFEIVKNSREGRFPNVQIKGLMGMASFTQNQNQIQSEFETLHSMYSQFQADENWNTLSMGMSGDYKLAIECGSNAIRVGSLLFGTRD